MSNRDRRIEELFLELRMLKIALEFFHEPPAREQISTRISACIAEYGQLVDGRAATELNTFPPDERRGTSGA